MEDVEAERGGRSGIEREKGEALISDRGGLACSFVISSVVKVVPAAIAAAFKVVDATLPAAWLEPEPEPETGTDVAACPR